MFEHLNTYGSFIRFSHSVFALPFALTGVLLASRHTPVTITTLLWIIAAMVSARAAAMGFNRMQIWWNPLAWAPGGFAERSRVDKIQHATVYDPRVTV